MAEHVIKILCDIQAIETRPGKKFALKNAIVQLRKGHLIGDKGNRRCKYIPAALCLPIESRKRCIETLIVNKVNPCIVLCITYPNTSLFMQLQYNTMHFALYQTIPTEKMSEFHSEKPAQAMFALYRRAETELCEREHWGDPHNYARNSEIHLANCLGHTIAEEYSGADAYDEEGPCEYKTTIAKNINGTYNGISICDTWEKQVEYLINYKIGKYPNHYFARRSGSDFVEIYKLTAHQVLNHLLPKLKKQFEKLLKKGPTGKKDGRLGASIPMSYINKHGIKINID